MSSEVDAMSREEKLLFLAAMDETRVTDTNVILKGGILAAKEFVKREGLIPAHNCIRSMEVVKC